MSACNTRAHYLTPINTSIVSSGQTLYHAAPLETNTSLLRHFTAESSRELRKNAVALRKSHNKQRQVSMFLILLFMLLTQFPFVSFLSISILSLSLSSLCSLSQSSLFSLSTMPSFFSDQFFVLLRFQVPLHSVSPMAPYFCFCILFLTMTYFFNDAIYKLVKTKF